MLLDSSARQTDMGKALQVEQWAWVPFSSFRSVETHQTGVQKGRAFDVSVCGGLLRLWEDISKDLFRNVNLSGAVRTWKWRKGVWGWGNTYARGSVWEGGVLRKPPQKADVSLCRGEQHMGAAWWGSFDFILKAQESHWWGKIRLEFWVTSRYTGEEWGGVTTGLVGILSKC